METHGRKLAEPDVGLDRIAHDVIGAAIEVHQALGPGFLESVYQEALCVELLRRQIPFQREYTVGLEYKGEPVGLARLDLLVRGSLIVELKAVDALAPIHAAQVLSYLKMTGCRLGLLLNFNVPVLRAGGIKRIVLS